MAAMLMRLNEMRQLTPLERDVRQPRIEGHIVPVEIVLEVARGLLGPLGAGELSAFACMRFRDPSIEAFFEQVVARTLSDLGGQCERCREPRADWTHYVADRIRDAQLVVLDITDLNQNLILEYGFDRGRTPFLLIEKRAEVTSSTLFSRLRMYPELAWYFPYLADEPFDLLLPVARIWMIKRITEIVLDRRAQGHDLDWDAALRAWARGSRAREEALQKIEQLRTIAERAAPRSSQG